MQSNEGNRPQTAQQQALNAWFVYAAATVLLFASCAKNIRSLLHDSPPYRLFASYWASGWAASHHLNPYAYYPMMWQLHPYPNNAGPLVLETNLNPPSMLPLFQLLARFPLDTDVIAGTLLSGALFALGAALLLGAHGGKMQTRQILWLLLSTCVTDTLYFGQDYAPMFALACVIWLLIRSEKTTAAAVCIGILIAMKPNLGLWPILLFVAGYRKPAYTSTATAATLSLWPALVYGPSIYRQWLAASAADLHYIFTADVSLIAIFTRLGSPLVGYVLAGLSAAALILFMRSRRPGAVDIAGIAVCAGILCAPIGWNYYILFAAPFFVANKWSTLETWAAILIALHPLFEPFFAPGHHPFMLLLITTPRILGIAVILTSFGEAWPKSQWLARRSAGYSAA